MTFTEENLQMAIAELGRAALDAGGPIHEAAGWLGAGDTEAERRLTQNLKSVADRLHEAYYNLKNAELDARWGRAA